MNRRDNRKGWIFFLILVLGMALVGYLEEQDARRSMAPPEPVSYHF